MDIKYINTTAVIGVCVCVCVCVCVSVDTLILLALKTHLKLKHCILYTDLFSLCTFYVVMLKFSI